MTSMTGPLSEVGGKSVGAGRRELRFALRTLRLGETMAINWKAAREGASALAVVVSLVFVGLEIRQNTLAQRAQTRQELANGSREYIIAMATNPHLGLAYRDILRPRDPGTLGGPQEQPAYSRQDTIAVLNMLNAYLRNVENVYLQYEEGVVDQRVLDTYGFEALTFQLPPFAEYWVTRRSRFDPNFVKAFEEANGIRVP